MPALQMDTQIDRSYWDCDRMTQRHLSGLSHWADTEAEAAGSSPLSLSQPKSNTHHVQKTPISTAQNPFKNRSHAKLTSSKTWFTFFPGIEINGIFQEYGRAWKFFFPHTNIVSERRCLENIVLPPQDFKLNIIWTVYCFLFIWYEVCNFCAPVVSQSLRCLKSWFYS